MLALSAVFLLLPVLDAAWTEMLYMELTATDRFNVTIAEQFSDHSFNDCGSRCSVDTACIAFVVETSGAPGGGHCVTLHEGHTDIQTHDKDQNVVFLKGCIFRWCPPYLWSLEDQPVLYRSFDVIGSLLQLNKGSQLMPGVNGKGGTTDLQKRQWIEISGAVASCLSKVDTCGPEGATFAVWIKLLQCPDTGGIVGSWAIRPSSKAVACVWHRDKTIRWRLNPESGYYYIDVTSRLSQWVHHVFVLHHLGDGEDGAFTLYENSVSVGAMTVVNGTANVAGPGRLVIGRRCVNYDDYYASVVLDELLLWNRKLTQQEIQIIYDMTN